MPLPNLFNIAERTKAKRMISVADLKPINNLKLIFREIRDYFAGNVTGITRDEKIAQNIMRLLFCKIYDEKNSVDAVEFSNRSNENYSTFQSRIDGLFEKVKKNYPDIFDYRPPSFTPCGIECPEATRVLTSWKEAIDTLDPDSGKELVLFNRQDFPEREVHADYLKAEWDRRRLEYRLESLRRSVR